MFNALKYTQELEKAGFSRQQAEASVKVLIEVMDQNFMTKADLKELEFRIDSRFLEVDSKFSKMESKFQELEYKLTVKLGAMLTVAIGATATLVKLL